MAATKLKTILIFLTSVIALSACSMDASIQSLVEELKVFKTSKFPQGFTSGSGQMKKDLTTGTNKVSASVGVVGGTNAVNNSLYHQTPAGYKVYSTVQGALVAK